MRQPPLLIVSLLLLLACGSASAQWKWRDANGRVTVSDIPPPSTVREQDIISQPANARRVANAPAQAVAASAAVGGAVPLPKSSTDPELEARRKRAADEKAAQQRQLDERDTAARAENCNRAKSYLGTLSDGRRVAHTNARGEVEALDDKARAEEMQRAREMIASDCK